jgi:hypothetical protein
MRHASLHRPSTQRPTPPAHPPPRCPRPSVPRHPPPPAAAPSPGSDALASELARVVLVEGLGPQPTAPSPLLSPAAVSAAVASALRRPDHPTDGAGPTVAFAFTLPAETGVGAPVASASGRRGRAWAGAEGWLNAAAFADHLAAHAPAALLREAHAVVLVGGVGFGGRAGAVTAVQAVDVESAPGSPPRRISVLMRLVEEGGPWRGCYLVWGVRFGDYAR